MEAVVLVVETFGLTHLKLHPKDQVVVVVEEQPILLFRVDLVDHKVILLDQVMEMLLPMVVAAVVVPVVLVVLVLHLLLHINMVEVDMVFNFQQHLEIQYPYQHQHLLLV
tara:strand:+ start:828 stop:1157 length:330 start_codon:yes stop_codon:yes gene_type:complete